MDWKSFVYGAISMTLLLLITISLGFAHIGSVNGKVVADSSSGNYGDIPEKCRPQAGYDLESWKEHLGHHADTQECLKYFR